MTDYRTPYGTIHYGGACEDDYRNMVTYDQGGGHTVVTLQRPAMKALKAAQVRYAKRVGWGKERLKREPDGRPISMLPGTNRSCATQRRLWLSDKNRYANPDTSGHPRGLALDVNQNQSNLAIIKAALLAEGWEQVRPSDEPWHFSYHLSI